MTTDRVESHEESMCWLARLDGEESPADHEAFARWHAVPENAAAYAQAQQLWRVLGGLSSRPDAKRLSAEVLAETAPQARRFFDRRVKFGLAAGVATCVFTVAAFIVGQNYTATQTYTTGPGERSTVVLDDGSQVVLNVATRLDVKLGKDRRRLTLRAGEAVFTVAQDFMRPFTVEAGGGKITAIGTRFQVRREARGITVTLLEGRIAVDRSEAQTRVQLNPGEQVEFSPGAPAFRRQTVDPLIAASWTTGRLKFRATPLSEVLEEVNRYARTKIRLRDAALGQTPVNGVFEMGNTESVVSALQVMLPVEVVEQDRSEVVLAGR